MPHFSKIAIVGAGPIGILLTSYFKKGGTEVYLFDKDKVKINLIKKE